MNFRCTDALKIGLPVRFLLQSKAVEKLSPAIQQNAEIGIEAEEPERKPAWGINNETRSQLGGKMNFWPKGMKRKRDLKVKFAGEDEAEPEAPVRPAKLIAGTTSRALDVNSAGPSINLCALESVCEYLRQHCGCPGTVADHKYFAYFQKRISSKYIFYVTPIRPAPEERGTALDSNNISLYEFLEVEKEETVTNVHQIKLALKLALAVLQYHSTAWLGSEWRLSQLMLTTDPTKLPDDFSLYLNSKLIPEPPMLPTPSATPERTIHNEVQMKEIPKKGQLSEAQRRGINNTTLFCLGIALLEIGRWKQLSSLAEDELDTDEIDTARRLSYSSSALGRRYDEIVRKCLQCNFGVGTDLNQMGLQSAVYTNVVCPLEELIEKLDGLSI